MTGIGSRHRAVLGADVAIITRRAIGSITVLARFLPAVAAHRCRRLAVIVGALGRAGWATAVVVDRSRDRFSRASRTAIRPRRGDDRARVRVVVRAYATVAVAALAAFDHAVAADGRTIDIVVRVRAHGATAIVAEVLHREMSAMAVATRACQTIARTRIAVVAISDTRATPVATLTRLDDAVATDRLAIEVQGRVGVGRTAAVAAHGPNDRDRSTRRVAIRCAAGEVITCADITVGAVGRTGLRAAARLTALPRRGIDHTVATAARTVTIIVY